MSIVREVQMTCSECSKEVEVGRFSEPTNGEMIKQELCFNCHFWTKRVEEFDNYHRFVANGTHYTIADEHSPSSFRGYGGARWVVTFYDGREVLTSNLWCQGDVPEHFRARLPDTATVESGWSHAHRD